MLEKYLHVDVFEDGNVETQIMNLTGDECANAIAASLAAFANVLRERGTSEGEINLLLRGLAEFTIENSDKVVKKELIIN